MKRIALLYGGRSWEHDISVITAIQLGEFWPDEYQLIPLYLRDGEIYSIVDWKRYASYTAKLRGKRCTFITGGVQIGNHRVPLDAALLATHGGEGEDGTIQSVLRYYGIPHSGPDALISGLCMDKWLAKKVLSALGFPVVDGQIATENYRGEFPVILKPAHLGSSIGITVAHDRETYLQGLYSAETYDKTVLVEPYLEGAEEYNCAALALDGTVISSAIERPAPTGKLYSFSDKYLQECKRQLPARLSAELEQEIHRLTCEVYQKLGMQGVIRVDFLYHGNRLYINEINTVPGAWSYRLWSEAGLPLRRLIQTVIKQITPYEKGSFPYAQTLQSLIGAAK